jgi:hypothetical protein
MELKKGWNLKGIFYECCRIVDGQCGLMFGRDLPEPCANLATYEIKEGKIHNVDMKGIIITFHMDGIGPKCTKLVGKIVGEGAVYISDNANDEQREILKSFVMDNMEGRMWKKCLGIKFVKIKISEENGIYDVTMPFGQQKISLTIGGDGKNPIRMENPRSSIITNVKFCNTDFWKYHDYGKKMKYHNTSGKIADFALKGEG